MIMRVSYVAGFQKGYQVGTAATQTKLMEMEESLREVLNTCFIKRDRKWYFKTHNGIPMEIPKKYIKIMMCAEAILSAPIKLEDNK